MQPMQDFSASFRTLGHHLCERSKSKKESHVWPVGGFLLKRASRSLLGILTAHVNVKILFFQAALRARTWHAAAYISHPPLQDFNKTLSLTMQTVHFSMHPVNSCAPFDLSSSTTVTFAVRFFTLLTSTFLNSYPFLPLDSS